jgi:superfamily II DNA or RNA helicase
LLRFWIGTSAQAAAAALPATATSHAEVGRMRLCRICDVDKSRPTLSTERDQLLARIAEEAARLGALEREREGAVARLEALRAQVAAISPTPTAPRLPFPGGSTVPSTPAEKVRLFRSLFRGREDVFPTRFESKKTGKAGYAPACTNKFVRGVCELPRVKCGECRNQAFSRFDDQAVLDHLRGRHVMGVYPLLQDESCWFLAVDFDKGPWKEDISAFVDTCRSLGVPVAVERSRSGNGAHAWFFFAAPLAAGIARNLGCYLITETTARHHKLGMESYDRLFPNQDTMPRHGFGNLIALPLQYDARKKGNTLFVDERFEPHSDQWAFLAGTPRMDVATVEAITREATRSGKVLGVRLAHAEDGASATPWARRPSGSPPRAPIMDPLPPLIRAVLSQRLFVETVGLPSPLLNQIKRLAAFQNPEFYKRQSMRLSTVMTPRVIACAEELAQHIALPRGCCRDLEELCREYGVDLIVDDQRHRGDEVSFRFLGDLTPIQEQAARALLAHDTGVFVAPPGIGKTVLGTHLIAERRRSTLILVHRRPLLEQWTTQLSMFLDIREKDVGQIGGGKRKPNGRLDVAMIQSLVRKGVVDDLVADYGHVIVDECHHVPAVSFERVLSEVRALYVTGLTATPQRRDGHHPILEMQLGPIRMAVDAISQAARRPFVHKLIVRETPFRLSEAAAEDMPIQEIYGGLVADEARNELIVDDVIRAIEGGRSPLLLTERKDHLGYLAERMRGFVRHVIVLQGGLTTKARRDLDTRLAEIPDHEERLILATGRYVGEGFDDPRLDTLFLAMPISWKGTVVQYTGRLHRLHPEKTAVQIFDYVDREVPVLLRMFEKRLRTYRAIGYARDEAPLGLAETIEELTVEYDEDALRYFDDAV